MVVACQLGLWQLAVNPLHGSQDPGGLRLVADVEELQLVPPYEDKRKAVIGRFYTVPIYKDPASRGAHFLFRSRDVETRLPSMFRAWLESAERLSVVRSLYFSGAYGKTFLELRLLAFAQAAEAYHRRVAGPARALLPEIDDAGCGDNRGARQKVRSLSKNQGTVF